VAASDEIRAVRPSVSLLDRPTLRVLFTVLVVAAGMAFLWLAWHVLAAFLFAIFFAYLIDPLVKWVARRARLSRGKAVAVVYLLVIAALVVLFLFVGPQIAHEAKKLAGSLPQLYENVASGQIAQQLGAQRGWSHETRQRIQEFLYAHRVDIDLLIQDIATRLARLGSDIWWLVLIPVLAVFFLKDGEKLSQAMVEVFNRPRQRELMEGLINDVNGMLAHYIRAQLLLAVLAMAAYVAGLNLLRVPYATILGVISGGWEFIPMVGPLISFFLILGVALGAGYTHLLYVVGFLAGWRVVEDYIISPRIMEKQLALHPLAILFGVLAGGEVGGIAGVYLSIPIMATIRILWRGWSEYSRQQNLPAG
jgi:predicted PurR-regulated permease PerM